MLKQEDMLNLSFSCNQLKYDFIIQQMKNLSLAKINLALTFCTCLILGTSRLLGVCVCVCVYVFSYRCVMSGTNFTGLPVLPAENTAVGLYNIQGQVENHAGLSL